MPSTPKDQVRQMLAAAAAACEDKKAEDIRILALDPTESGLTDFFLIATGNSDRQNVAITDEIEIRLKRDFATYPNSVEGRRQGEWILMDYVDFIVHVFSAEKRAFYGLERLRKSATVLSIEDLNAQLKSQIKATITAGRKKASPKKALAVRKTVSEKKSVTKKLAAKKSLLPKTAPRTVATEAVAKKATAAATKKVIAKKAVTSAAKKTLAKSL